MPVTDKELAKKKYKSDWAKANRAKLREKARNRTPEQKLADKEYQRLYRLNKRPHLKRTDYFKEYNKTDKAKEVRKRCYEKTKEKRLNYINKRLKEDPIFNLKHKIRNRIWTCLKRKGFGKTHKRYEYLGCTFEYLKEHIEKLFKPGMNWENHGKWHIDHITPLSRANTVDEVYQLCHYSNLQPLWGIENLRKNDR